MQYELQLERFSMCCRNQIRADMHRTPFKRRMEYRFKHNPDMDRKRLGSSDGRGLQYNFKHNIMQIQV